MIGSESCNWTRVVSIVLVTHMYEKKVYAQVMICGKKIVWSRSLQKLFFAYDRFSFYRKIILKNSSIESIGRYVGMLLAAGSFRW